MRTSRLMIDQINYDRQLVLATGGDLERLPPFAVSRDEYRVLVHGMDANTTRYAIETDLKMNMLRPFMGRALVIESKKLVAAIVAGSSR